MEVRTIARDACIYGFPLVDHYRILHAFFVDRTHPEHKGPWNQVSNVDRVSTPDDRAVQTPNADTPYSYLGADLRAEPLVLTVPAIDGDRYFSAQVIDLHTFTCGYAGTRTTGNDGGRVLLAGPSWRGKAPSGITAVIRCETELVFVLYRTQLFGSGDLDNVRRIQAGYHVGTLSALLGRGAPPAAPAIEFIDPIDPAVDRTSLEFFAVLDFVLRLCPTHPSEKEWRARLGRIGIGTGLLFDAQTLSLDTRRAIEDGMADAWKTFAEFKTRELDTGRVTASDGFGSRADLKQNYLHRMAAAMVGIHGNAAEEAIYPTYFVDSTGQALNGGTGRYALRFPPDDMPPARAFWSLTAYDLPSRRLFFNALHRQVINSAMLPDLRRDPDRAITVSVQHESPGTPRESNWLPAPRGPFFCILRLYWPRPEALHGPWRQPPMQRLA
jgi:hypothetical protein